MFLEAVTYRMGPHTTSDDPTRYRERDEVERWRARDPLTRLEALLRSTGDLDDAALAAISQEADALTGAMREAVLTAVTRPPLAVLDDVYAEPHSGLSRQRQRFAAYLDSFADGDAEVSR